jgi:glycosyltransferase involved in cell wall biosynthesis
MTGANFCTTIIPTVGRATLARAVESVLDQSFTAAPIEVVVVNDSGQPLPAEAWQGDARLRQIVTQRRERSVARNAGSALARGRYLHFLDDDDWLRPGALQALWQLAQESDAAWLFGGSQLVNDSGHPLARLEHGQPNGFVQVMAGEWIPLQASLIAADAFFAVGGFNPTLVGPEDIDLLRRVALRYPIAGTTAVVANIVRGQAGTTTDYERHPLASRRAREASLDAAGAFDRLRGSATTPFWRGRMARIYLTSAVWNVLHRRPIKAISRGLYGLMAFLMSGASLSKLSFWRALRRPYQSASFVRRVADGDPAIFQASEPAQ